MFGGVDPQNALDVAQRIVELRFPDAVAAFVSGSALTDGRTFTSDLDIVIVLRGGPAPFRETIREFGWPVEIFVHTPTSIDYFSTLEAVGHRATTHKMIAEGHILLSVDGEAERVRAAAYTSLSQGPPPPSIAEMNKRRYALTDQLDDFLATTDPTELLFIVAQLVTGSSELALLSKLHWLATGKWLARHLAVSDPDLSTRLVKATKRAVADGEKNQMEGIVREILERVGGPLKEGYRAEDVLL
jgi:hypothetical protein